MQKLIPLDSRRRKSFRTRLQALRAGLTFYIEGISRSYQEMFEPYADLYWPKWI